MINHCIFSIGEPASKIYPAQTDSINSCNSMIESKAEVKAESRNYRERLSPDGYREAERSRSRGFQISDCRFSIVDF